MSDIHATFEIPAHIEQGLQNGTYERVGGVVRQVDSKQIVGWLREVHETGEPVLSEILSLSSVGAVSSTLNLAISTMGFAVVLHRLKGIEKQLELAQEALDAIGYKIDLSFYANFQAALDLALNAFTMSNPETRRMSAMQAINRFLEAEHHYTKLVDIEINNGSQVADEYLATLSLAYVTEVRCYLELEEIGTAFRRLQDGIKELRPRFQKHITTLLTSNPAAYLHPSLNEEIDLKRLTKVYQWLTPGVDEGQVFESLREDLFNLAIQPQEWIALLPQAIRMPKKSEAGKFDIFKQTRRITSALPGLPRGMPGRKASSPETTEENATIEIFKLLPGTMGLIELMIETDHRLEMYRTEIETIEQMKLSFREWRELKPSATGNAGLMYISLPE